MSIHCSSWAWRQQLSATDKLVLLALSDHANDEDFSCWPSLTHLARKCGLNRSTIKRVLKRLEDSKYLVRYNRGRATTVYTLFFNADSNHVRKEPRSAVHLGAQDKKARRNESDEVGAQCATEPSTEPLKKHQDSAYVTVSGTSAPSGFDDYWAVVPRKVKRKDAQAVWKRQKLDSLADQIIADVKYRLANDDRWRQGYIPDPPTYLRQERWMDDLVTNGAGTEQDNTSLKAWEDRAI